MSEALREYTLDVDDIETYTIDWSPYLRNGETISSAAWTLPTAIVADVATSNSSFETNIRLQATGSVGDVAKVECAITTSNSNERSAHFLVRLTN